MRQLSAMALGLNVILLVAVIALGSQILGSIERLEATTAEMTTDVEQISIVVGDRQRNGTRVDGTLLYDRMSISDQLYYVARMMGYVCDATVPFSLSVPCNRPTASTFEE